MGVINTLEEILAIIFKLEVVQDITQTKVERAISYQITNDVTRTFKDSAQVHMLSVDLTLRAENGYDALGWMTQKLTDGPVSGAGWKVLQVSGSEQVDYVNKGEILISTGVTIKMTVHHDQVKERIKTINMEAQ